MFVLKNLLGGKSEIGSLLTSNTEDLKGWATVSFVHINTLGHQVSDKDHHGPLVF